MKKLSIFIAHLDTIFHPDKGTIRLVFKARLFFVNTVQSILFLYHVLFPYTYVKRTTIIFVENKIIRTKLFHGYQ